MAKERRGASWVAGNGNGGELSLLQAEAQMKEEARRGNDSTGVSGRVLGR